MTRLPTSTKGQRVMRSFALSFACVATFASVHALAEPTAAERSLAAALFDQGRTLMADGKLDEACVKFTESQRLDPGGGTLLNLALCHEKQGKIATAWTEFREARAMAKSDNRPDRESAAEGEIRKLEPQLSKLSIVVGAANKVDGLTVEIDGLPLPEAAWGTPFPVDPGTRTIIAKAPGYTDWKSTVEIGKTAGTADINVPKLEKAAATTVPPPPPTGTVNPPPPPPTGSSIVTPPPVKSEPDVPMSPVRKAGFVVGGLGLVLVGIGSGAGITAIQKDRAADPDCSTTTCATPEALKLAQDATKWANVSTGTFIVGLAGVAVGTVMIIMAPKTAPVQASLSVGPQFVSVTGKF